MIFLEVIIHTTSVVRKSHSVHQGFMWHLDLWESGQHTYLLDDTVVEI